LGCVSQHDQHKRQIANILFRNREPASATLPSSGIQSLLEEADADVLFLYDCCHSAALPTSDTQSQDSGGVKEVLAACGFESIAPGVDKHSFTKALIETLALASRKLTFSIPELHSRVLSRIMGWTPGLMKDEDGKFVKITEGPGRGRLALDIQHAGHNEISTKHYTFTTFTRKSTVRYFEKRQCQFQFIVSRINRSHRLEYVIQEKKETQ
jgi:hypothetical protein